MTQTDQNAVSMMLDSKTIPPQKSRRKCHVKEYLSNIEYMTINNEKNRFTVFTPACHRSIHAEKNVSRGRLIYIIAMLNI